MELGLLALAWAAYFLLHSLLAALWLKDLVKRRFPRIFASYRLLYSTISVGGLLALLYTMSIGSQDFIFTVPALIILGSVLLGLGLFFLYKAFQAFDGAEFIGLKAESTPVLVQSGMYQYVRHPLYFATILIIGGLFLVWPTAQMAVTLAVAYVYILVGYRLEEVKLRMVFGSDYDAYQQQVRALIPFIY